MLTSLLPPREACRSLGHIFDGILGIKSHIKVMPTLKFVVPEPWLNLRPLLPVVPNYPALTLETSLRFYVGPEKVGDVGNVSNVSTYDYYHPLCFIRHGSRSLVRE